MEPEKLEQIAMIADSAENFAVLSKLSLPPQKKIEALTTGLREIRDRLQAFCKDNGMRPVWEDGMGDPLDVLPQM